MNATRPVLVTTDGSSHSHRVLPYAAQLASALEAPLVLLTVVGGAGDVAPVEAELRATLSRLGLQGEPRVEVNETKRGTADVILDVARAEQASVLAIDSRGHGALRHVLHGSVALDVLSRADLPLLVSGPNLEPSPPSADTYDIVATSDGSPASGAVLGAIASLGTPEGLSVTLLRVHEDEPGGADNTAIVRQCEEQLEAARKQLPLEMAVETLVQQIPRGAGVDTAIIEAAVQRGANAIAMSTHGHSARQHVVMGSVALLLLGRSPLPLLLARAAV